MKNFKPLALASLVSLASAGVTAGPLNDLLGSNTLGLTTQLDAAARSIQGNVNAGMSNSPFGQTNTPTLFGVTVFEPADRQNADIAALSVGSGDNTGNGGVAGIAVLAGDDSGNGGVVSVSALSPNEALRLGLGGQDQTIIGNEADALSSNLEPYGAGQMNETLYDGLGREELRGDALTEQFENQVRDMHMEMVANGAQGGSTTQIPGAGGAGVATLSGFEGDDAASGSDVGVAVMSSGDRAAQGDLAGVAVISGDDAARGELVNVAVVGGDNSAQGGLVNVAALSGADSGQGGVVNAQIANEPTTSIGNNEAVLNLAVLHRDENVEQGTVGIGIITIPKDPTVKPRVELAEATSTASESENCGTAQHEVTIRGLPVIAGPRLGTQFADPRAETKVGECARPVSLALAD